jgi:hypothetical protein
MKRGQPFSTVHPVMIRSQPALVSEPPKPSAHGNRLDKPLPSTCQAQYQERKRR